MNSQKILIIEDDEQLLNTLEERLKKDFPNTISATNGTSGIEKALGEKPSLIVTDLVMFPLTGIDVLKKIRLSGSWGAKVPCIVYSNDTEEHSKVILKGLDVKAFFNKDETSVEEITSYIIKLLS